MKEFCPYCQNDPVTHMQQKEICGTCERETEVAKRKSICFNCEHSSYCKNALLYDDESSIVMKGCSRFKEKHKQTRGDWIRSKTDEELAKWLVNLEVKILNRQPMLDRPALEKDWLEWLKEEVKE